LKLIINGEERHFEQPAATVAHLLKHLALPVARAAVELNGAVVEHQQIEATALQEGDRIEIVSFVGGG
jgi:sulfur carrier protein